MSLSPTTKMLARAIDRSDLGLTEIADRCGFRLPATLLEIAQGDMQVPLDRIPDLARTLQMDGRQFLVLAIQEYHPGVFEVLVETLGIHMEDAELGVIAMFRIANIRGQVEVEDPFRKALEGVLDLSRLARG